MTINDPRWTGITQPVLIKFEVAYATVKDKAAGINRTPVESNQITIKQCIKPELLHGLAICGSRLSHPYFGDMYSTVLPRNLPEPVAEYYYIVLTGVVQ